MMPEADFDLDGDGSLDPGLAAERTDIAWSRSALALVTCTAAVLKRVPHMSRAESIGLVVAVAAMLAAASLLLRRRIAGHQRDPAIVMSRLRLRNVALLTTFTGALCLAVMFLTIS
jgi:uncharacterized membrane protein YidH (DUF202 family)